MKLRKTPRTRRMAKAARDRKRKRDGLIGQWNFVGGNATHILDTSFDAGDIITISGDGSNDMSFRVGDIPKPKNPKRVHPARKRKAKQMMKPLTEAAQWISIGSGQTQIEKISETQWRVIGTGIS